MKNILFLIMLMPLFTVGQDYMIRGLKNTPAYFRIDSNGNLVSAHYNKKDSFGFLGAGNVGNIAVDTIYLLTPKRRCTVPFDSLMMIKPKKPTGILIAY